LILISVASILGTLIPQQEAAGSLISRLNPGVADVLRALQLFNIYHSAWFMLLMALLATNLIICSLKPVSCRLEAFPERTGTGQGGPV